MRTAVLSDQQNRVERAAEQLENIRSDVRRATLEVNRFDARVSNLSEELSVATTPGRRRELEQAIRSMTTEKNVQESQLQLAKSLESEQLRVLQTEQRRWDELVDGAR